MLYKRKATKETGGNTIVMAEENVANLMEVLDLYEADTTTSFALNNDCLFFFTWHETH